MIKGQTRENVVGVVVARGGSKGLPGKNIRPLRGKPLLAYTLEAARAARRLDRVILSTDAPEIAEVGKKYGAEVPFLRPKRLARDRTNTPPVIEHAVRYLEEHERYRVDIVVTLQPTSPLRRSEHIDAAIKLLLENPRFDSVISVREEVIFSPFWMFRAKGKILVPFVDDGTDYSLKERQELPKVYQPNGAVYVTRRELLREKGVVFSAYAGGRTGFTIMDSVSSLDIDSHLDLVVAETLMEGRYAER